MGEYGLSARARVEVNAVAGSRGDLGITTGVRLVDVHATTVFGDHQIGDLAGRPRKLVDRRLGDPVQREALAHVETDAEESKPQPVPTVLARYVFELLQRR